MFSLHQYNVNTCFTLYLCTAKILRKIRTYLTLFFCAIGLLSNAQFAPIPRCITLDINDDVTLFWEQPADTGADFNSIRIAYAIGSSNNFTTVANITDFNQTSVLLTGSYAVPGRFILQQIYNGFADTSEVLDTVSPILLGVTSTDKAISLGWNPTGLPSADSIFRLQKEINGSFSLFKALDFPLTAANDSILTCSEEVAYRLEVTGIGGCVSRSNTVRLTVEDNMPPNRANLYFASVDTATGFVNLQWQASSSADRFGYLISYFEDFTRTDTVFGGNNLTYTYTRFQINGLLQAETLSVAPFDSCFDAANGWYNQSADDLRFKTMYFDTAGFDRCGGKLFLTWSKPEPPFRTGVRDLSGYRVYRKSASEGSILLATLGAADTAFVDSTLQQGVKYTYVVAPYDEVNGFEALSNKVVIDLAEKSKPDYLYISSVENDHETGDNVVHLFADTTAESRSYGLLRSMQRDEGFIELFRESEDLKESMELIDDADAADQGSFYYQVVAYDLCDDELARSQVVQSLYLEGEKNIRDLINTVNWSNYQGYDTAGTEVATYELFRVIDGREDELLFSGLAPNHYTDEIATLDNLSGDVCYYVQAPETDGNLFGFNAVSRSNLRCFNYPPRVFIPNAFTPDNDGRNDIFLPYVNYVDPTAYSLRIYDRMGRLVFSTSDPTEGWNGEGLQGGIYAYSLTLSNAFDEPIEYAGSVLMIK